MELDNYLSALEEETGKLISVLERIPGVYLIETDQGKCFSREYFAVLDTSPIAAKVRNYGKKIDGLRLFPWDDPSCGQHIIQYEINKYRIAAGSQYLTEWQFRDMSFHAMELHPEYFGMFPVPFRTPSGYTLLHQTLANGIYWLETSECREMLAVCPPVWEAELSFVAKAFAESLERGKGVWLQDIAGYLFFSKEVSCIPIYELMETRKHWEGTVIDRPALMNAIWAFLPVYAMHLNGQRDLELEAALTALLGEDGAASMPGPNQKDVAGMYPGAGTDFLLLRRQG